MDLRQWVSHWSGKYPDPTGEDAMLADFRGAEHFTRNQVEQLIDWKFKTDSRRRQRTHNLLAIESNERIEEVTRRAFSSNSDYEALISCQRLKGLGPATASVLLMAQAPDKYTVIDSRALTSMRALGRFSGNNRFAETEDWGPYLTECRSIVDLTGFALRQVDRAMYAANGRLDHPPAA